MLNAKDVQKEEKLGEVEEIKRDRSLALRHRRERTWRVSCCFAIFFAVALGCSMSVVDGDAQSKYLAPIPVASK